MAPQVTQTGLNAHQNWRLSWDMEDEDDDENDEDEGQLGSDWEPFDVEDFEDEGDEMDLDADEDDAETGRGFWRQFTR